MSFVSIDFVLFAAVLYPLFSLILYRAPVLSITIASLFFYSWINIYYLFLILLSAAIDYGAALLIERSKSMGTRKIWLAISVCLNLAILIFFKYWNFFLPDVDDSESVSFETYAVPLGLSFYTLQSIGYTVDVYKNKTKAEPNFVVYLLFVSFFPQLVAGPIERSKRLLPQLRRMRDPDTRMFLSGLLLFLWGATIKLCVADNFSPFVNAALTPEKAGMATWVACLLGMFYVYCDFHAYTLMARGLARGLGVELSHNFRQPFFARSLSGFWRRWHITLTTWIIDYVHLPIARRFPDEPFRSVSAIFAMVLVGLWHGASWNFILFGLLHGVALRFWFLVDGATDVFKSRGLREMARSGCLLIFLAISAPLFLVASLDDCLLVLKGMFSLELGLSQLLSVPGKIGLFCGVVVATLVLADDYFTGRNSRYSVEATAGAIGKRSILYGLGMISLIVVFANFRGQNFVYFQF